MKKITFIVVALLLSVPVFATQVVQTTIGELSDAADIIFHGTCVGREIAREGGDEVTRWDFNVIEIIKDNSGKLEKDKAYSFCHPGLPPSVGKTKGVEFYHGMPEYVKGNEYLLFLSGPSGVGCRTPLGFGQGQFFVNKKPDGTKSVANAFNNRGLFKNVPRKGLSKAEVGITKAESGPVDYDMFVSIVKKVGNK